MAQDWLLREIEALRDFARLNDLPRLAEALDQARLVAALELDLPADRPRIPRPRNPDRFDG